MAVQVLYFASLREALGTAGETVELPEGVGTVGQLRDWLASARGRSSLVSARQLRCARNQEIVSLASPIADGDEVAFFPPVTGG